MVEIHKSWRRRILITFVVMIAVAGGYFAVRRISLGLGAKQISAEQRVYYCPMHPHYKSDKPGNCPICSMKLVEMAGPGDQQPKLGAEEMPISEGSAIFIDPRHQQIIGINSVPATFKPLVKEIRAVGKVTYDETQVAHVHTKFPGYLEEVFVDYVGKVVKRGDPLFTIYSPELVSAQEEYLLALRAARELSENRFAEISSGVTSLVEAARRKLELFDISGDQIKAIEREGRARRTLTIYSPVSGVVIERAAYHHGRYIAPETDLYMIVDLSTVWVIGEVYEYELPFVEVGQTAEIEFPYAFKRKSLRGRVSYIYPYLDPKTRTAKVRFQFRNPNFELKPDMFVNVRLKVNLGTKLVVPEDAVMDTGTEQYVFVDKGEGYFEPRLVKLGAEAGGYYAIEGGLNPGERVVISANFILDSESRLRGAFAGMQKPSFEPAKVPPATTAAKLQIELLEPKIAKVGKNRIRVRVLDAFGNPIVDAEVEVTFFMSMGSMPPMMSRAILSHGGGGEYSGEAEIQMAGGWQTTVSVKRAGRTLGSMQTTVSAR
jgi:Cu(I)/Ag(I) efflux system membrane fusion protein